MAILRAYRKYRQRIGSRFTEGYQNDVIAANPHITAKLIRLFELRNDPAIGRDEEAEAALREDILVDLEAVPSLDHDRILRNQLGLIEATVRTNAYRSGRRSIAFKLSLGRRPGDPAAAAAVRDLRLRARGRGDPPARRADRPRRPALVGPHGLPHRGLRAHARADDQERGHRARRRQGRLLPAPAPRRPGRAEGRGRARLRHASSAACSTSPTTSSRARSCIPRACACSTATTPTWWWRPTRARRRSPTPPTASRGATASGWATHSRPAARRAMTTRRWGSPRAAPGSRSSATSASSRWIRPSTSSPRSASATCPATSSATGCC